MPVTLADLLNERTFRLECVSGHRLLHRRVGWVHVAEVNDPTPWLTSGVLLLTTGLFERSSDQLDAFFAALAEQGVAAVGFGVGISTDEVPGAWIGAAERHGVPLLRVPIDTPYIAVSEFVSRRIADAQMDQVGRMLGVQQLLARSQPAAEVQLGSLALLGRELASAVLYRDTTDESPTAGGLTAAGEDVGLGSAELRAIAAELTRHDDSGRPSGSVSIGDLFAHLVSTAGPPIAVVRRSRYTPVEQGIIGSIAMFIDLEPPQSRSEPGTEASPALAEAILADISSGALDPSPRLCELVLPGTDVRVSLRLAPQAVDSPLDPGPTESAARLLRARLAGAAELADPLVWVDGAGIGAVVRGSADDACRLLTTFLVGGSELLGDWRAGASGGRPAAEFTVAQQEAATALRATTAGERVRGYASLSEAERLRSWLSESNRPAVYGEWAQRLASSEPSAAARMLAAIRSFLGANGGIERAAAELGVHRQTLHARLAEAERALGVSLDSATDRALLWLALECGALDEE